MGTPGSNLLYLVDAIARFAPDRDFTRQEVQALVDVSQPALCRSFRALLRLGMIEETGGEVKTRNKGRPAALYRSLLTYRNGARHEKMQSTKSDAQLVLDV